MDRPAAGADKQAAAVALNDFVNLVKQGRACQQFPERDATAFRRGDRDDVAIAFADGFGGRQPQYVEAAALTEEGENTVGVGGPDQRRRGRGHHPVGFGQGAVGLLARLQLSRGIARFGDVDHSEDQAGCGVLTVNG